MALSVVLENVSNDFVWVFFGMLLVCVSVVAWSFAFDEVSASDDSESMFESVVCRLTTTVD